MRLTLIGLTSRNQLAFNQTFHDLFAKL